MDYNTNMKLFREEGIAEGEKKKQLAIAKKMLAKKIPINEIIEITELTKEEIEKLLNQ